MIILTFAKFFFICLKTENACSVFIVNYLERNEVQENHCRKLKRMSSKAIFNSESMQIGIMLK